MAFYYPDNTANKSPTKIVGTRFMMKNTEMEFTDFIPVDPSLKYTIKTMEDTGKHAGTFIACRVLQSGKLSKTTKAFYIFKESGNVMAI